MARDCGVNWRCRALRGGEMRVIGATDTGIGICSGCDTAGTPLMVQRADVEAVAVAPKLTACEVYRLYRRRIANARSVGPTCSHADCWCGAVVSVIGRRGQMAWKGRTRLGGRGFKVREE